MARSSDFIALITGSEASDEAKARAAALLRINAKLCTVEEAAAELGVSAQRLHEIRAEALAGLVAACEPRPPGRPRTHSEAEERLLSQIAELRQQVNHLEVAREADRVRAEVQAVLGSRLKKNSGRRPAGV